MRSQDIKYLFAYILPASGFLAVYARGVWSYLAVLIAFGAIPLLELISGTDHKNLSNEEYLKRSEVKLFDWLLFLNIPLFYTLLLYTFYVVSSFPLARYELTGIILSVGIIGGSAGINVAHELGHKPGVIYQLGAKILLCPCLYMHFIIEHNRGHHLYVSTPQDPATSRYGELVYTFWLRSVIMSYLHAWKLESIRLKRLDKSIFSFNNEMIRFTFIQFIYLVFIFFAFGPLTLFIAISIGCVAFLLLETINYIEHYGLMRKLLPGGRYERVNVNHSWNSDHIIGRIMLYELTRHSDHHYKASKKYQTLESYETSPQLPFGYPTSMLIALIPPLWFYIMNPKVKQVELSN
ncbi:MAG: alkane 1-monooxygenase [Saprospiraceae bacterium]|nr:alkane 1-monooxygenase [Saprospiraceae bacterium]